MRAHSCSDDQEFEFHIRRAAGKRKGRGLSDTQAADAAGIGQVTAICAEMSDKPACGPRAAPWPRSAYRASLHRAFASLTRCAPASRAIRRFRSLRRPPNWATRRLAPTLTAWRQSRCRLGALQSCHCLARCHWHVWLVCQLGRSHPQLIPEWKAIVSLPRSLIPSGCKGQVCSTPLYINGCFFPVGSRIVAEATAAA